MSQTNIKFCSSNDTVFCVVSVCRHPRKLTLANNSKKEQKQAFKLRLKQLPKARDSENSSLCTPSRRSVRNTGIPSSIALRTALYGSCYSKNNEKPHRHEDGVDIC